MKPRILVGLVLAVALTIFGLPPATISSPAAAAAAGTGVTYTYDKLGQLKTVTDATGARATYNYDAVGNLLSIVRSTVAPGDVKASQTRAAPKPTISQIDRTEASVADEVSITGTGFSPDPLDNTVRFGRIVATVVNASETRLVVAVPPGATVGRVRVTTPGGNAISDQTVTVAAIAEEVETRALEVQAVETAKGLLNRVLPDAPRGATALSGQVLKLDGSPLAGVTMSIGKAQAVSDQAGKFLLKAGAPGHQKLVIDGGSVPGPDRYGVYEAGVDLAAGKTTKLAWDIWMPVQDKTFTVKFPSPTTEDVVVTNPGLPGAEIRVPAGTKIIDRFGKPVTELTLTPLPLDKTPIPLAPGMPIYFDLQPGGATVEGPGLKVVYPNATNHPAGTRLDFVTHDPNSPGMGWRAYGSGLVTPEGKIVPDARTAIYRTSGFSVIFNPLCQDPSGCPPPGEGSEDGDPVNLSTGLFVMEKTDLILPDVIPVALTRTYRQNHQVLQAFGIGQNHGFDLFIAPDSSGNYVLALPDGGKVPFSPGADGIYRALSTPTQFNGAVLTRVSTYDFRINVRDGTVLTFGVKTAGLVGIADRFGNKLTIVRNANGQIQRITGPNGRWLALTWGVCTGTSICVTKVSDNIGRSVRYAYDAFGRLIRVTDAAGKNTNYAWAPCDGSTCTQLLSITDPMNTTWLTNEFDSNGRVTKQTQADGTTFGFAYVLDTAGKVTKTTVTDPRGIARAVSFNAAGFTISDTLAVGRPEQQVSTITRDASNQVTTTVDPLNRATAFTYDTLGNVKSVTRLSGTASAVTTSFTYEAAYSRIATVTDPLSRVTKYAYNDQAQTITVTNPLNASSVTTLLEGRPVMIKDALGNRTDLSYLDGDLVAVSDPLGRVATRYLDAGGRLRRVTDPMGNYVQHNYDALNQVVSTTNPLGGVTSFTYDANGNLTMLQDAKLQATTYAYDKLDRPTTRTDPLGRSQTYAYDTSGNVITVTDRNGKISRFVYDGLSRQTSATFGWTATASESTITYTYDAGNRRTKAVDSTSGTVNRVYDLLDRMTSETTSQGSVSYTYDKANRRLTMIVGGQPQVSYAYDNRDRVTTITQGSAVARYDYDVADRQTSRTLPNGLVQKYAYDVSSQLTSITYVSGTSNIGDLTYAYDASGRRTSVGGTYARTGLPAAVAAATYNANNEVLTFGGTTFTYDKEGQVKTEGSNTYSWDARGQLTSIGGGTTANFAYDAFRRRTQRVVAASTTTFLYDGANLVQELSGGVPTVNLLIGLAVDETFTRTDSVGTRQFLTDVLNSTIALTDNARAITTSYTYEPFGKTTISGAADKNPFQYTGRENDSIGIYYYRARYYNPNMQRFTSEDPLEFNGGQTNLSSYVGNSPTNFIDPSGQIFGVGAVLGGVIGGVVGLATSAGGYGVTALVTGHWDWQEFGGVAAGGALGGAVTGGCIGSGVGLLVAAGCGAAGGAAGRLAENLLSGRKNQDPFDGVLCSGAMGAVSGMANGRIIKTHGAPSRKLSNVWNPGTNAKRMYGDNFVTGVGGVGVANGLGALNVPGC